MQVAIVGGGVIGCAVALRLAREKVSVTVVERGIPGAEASSAAGGILGAQAESSSSGPFLELCLKSRALYPDFAAEVESISGMKVGHRRCGLLELAHDLEEVSALERTCAWQREAGLRVEVLAPEALRRLEPALGDDVRLAAHFPDDAQVDNRALMGALVAAAKSLGVTFREGAVERILERGGRAVGVAWAGERIEADAVVVAAGAWSARIEGVGLPSKAVQPARGQMVCLRTPTPVLTKVVFGRGRYLVPRADGRVICGSTVELGSFDKAPSAEGISGILRDALRVCPALKDAKFAEHWAGLRPHTRDQLPILGPGTLPGLFFATGHFRNGILLTPITARILADSILGRTPLVDLGPFTWNRASLRGASAPGIGTMRRGGDACLP